MRGMQNWQMGQPRMEEPRTEAETRVTRSQFGIPSRSARIQALGRDEEGRGYGGTLAGDTRRTME